MKSKLAQTFALLIAGAVVVSIASAEPAGDPLIPYSEHVARMRIVRQEYEAKLRNAPAPGEHTHRFALSFESPSASIDLRVAWTPTEPLTPEASKP